MQKRYTSAHANTCEKHSVSIIMYNATQTRRNGQTNQYTHDHTKISFILEAHLLAALTGMGNATTHRAHP